MAAVPGEAVTPMTAPTVKGRTRFITLADLDGRSRAARNARDIAAAMTADLGGEQDLTEARRQLIQRAVPPRLAL